MKLSNIRRAARKGDFTIVPYVMMKDIWREEQRKEETVMRSARAAAAKAKQKKK